MSQEKKTPGDLCKYFAYRVTQLDSYGELGGTLWARSSYEPVGLASGSEFLPLIAGSAACDQATPGQGKLRGSSNMTLPLQAGLRDTILATRLVREWGKHWLFKRSSVSPLLFLRQASGKGFKMGCG